MNLELERDNFINYTFEEILSALNLKKIKRKYFSLKEDKENFEEKFEDFLGFVKDKNLIELRGIYKFLKAKKFYNSIILYYIGKQIKLKFPRQRGKDGVCISDFLEKERGSIAFFILTSGVKPLKEAKKLKDRGNFLKSYFLEILALESAEAGAMVLNKEIGKKWGLSKDFYGKRFSFGYPSCPDLSYQKILFEILKPERIGIKLTENFMMEPENSVSGFILKNLKAKYFKGSKL